MMSTSKIRRTLTLGLVATWVAFVVYLGTAASISGVVISSPSSVKGYPLSNAPYGPYQNYPGRSPQWKWQFRGTDDQMAQASWRAVREAAVITHAFRCPGATNCVSNTIALSKSFNTGTYQGVLNYVYQNAGTDFQTIPIPADKGALTDYQLKANDRNVSAYSRAGIFFDGHVISQNPADIDAFLATLQPGEQAIVGLLPPEYVNAHNGAILASRSGHVMFGINYQATDNSSQIMMIEPKNQIIYTQLQSFVADYQNALPPGTQYFIGKVNQEFWNPNYVPNPNSDPTPFNKLQPKTIPIWDAPPLLSNEVSAAYGALYQAQTGTAPVEQAGAGPVVDLVKVNGVWQMPGTVDASKALFKGAISLLPEFGMTAGRFLTGPAGGAVTVLVSALTENPPLDALNFFTNSPEFAQSQQYNIQIANAAYQIFHQTYPNSMLTPTWFLRESLGCTATACDSAATPFKSQLNMTLNAMEARDLSQLNFVILGQYANDPNSPINWNALATQNFFPYLVGLHAWSQMLDPINQAGASLASQAAVRFGFSSDDMLAGLLVMGLNWNSALADLPVDNTTLAQVAQMNAQLNIMNKVAPMIASQVTTAVNYQMYSWSPQDPWGDASLQTRVNDGGSSVASNADFQASLAFGLNNYTTTPASSFGLTYSNLPQTAALIWNYVDQTPDPIFYSIPNLDLFKQQAQAAYNNYNQSHPLNDWSSTGLQIRPTLADFFEKIACGGPCANVASAIANPNSGNTSTGPVNAVVLSNFATQLRSQELTLRAVQQFGGMGSCSGASCLLGNLQQVLSNGTDVNGINPGVQFATVLGGNDGSTIIVPTKNASDALAAQVAQAAGFTGTGTAAINLGYYILAGIQLGKQAGMGFPSVAADQQIAQLNDVTSPSAIQNGTSQAIINFAGLNSGTPSFLRVQQTGPNTTWSYVVGDPSNAPASFLGSLVNSAPILPDDTFFVQTAVSATGAPNYFVQPSAGSAPFFTNDMKVNGLLYGIQATDSFMNQRANPPDWTQQLLGTQAQPSLPQSLYTSEYQAYQAVLSGQTPAGFTAVDQYGNSLGTSTSSPPFDPVQFISPDLIAASATGDSIWTSGAAPINSFNSGYCPQCNDVDQSGGGAVPVITPSAIPGVTPSSSLNQNTLTSSCVVNLDLGCGHAYTTPAGLGWSVRTKSARVSLYQSTDVQGSVDNCRLFAQTVMSECQITTPVASVFYPDINNPARRTVDYVISANPKISSISNLPQAFQNYFSSTNSLLLTATQTTALSQFSSPFSGQDSIALIMNCQTGKTYTDPNCGLVAICSDALYTCGSNIACLNYATNPYDPTRLTIIKPPVGSGALCTASQIDNAALILSQQAMNDYSLVPWVLQQQPVAAGFSGFGAMPLLNQVDGWVQGLYLDKFGTNVPLSGICASTSTSMMALGLKAVSPGSQLNNVFDSLLPLQTANTPNGPKQYDDYAVHMEFMGEQLGLLDNHGELSIPNKFEDVATDVEYVTTSGKNCGASGGPFGFCSSNYGGKFLTNGTQTSLVALPNLAFKAYNIAYDGSAGYTNGLLASNEDSVFQLGDGYDMFSVAQNSIANQIRNGNGVVLEVYDPMSYNADGINDVAREKAFHVVAVQAVSGNDLVIFDPWARVYHVRYAMIDSGRGGVDKSGKSVERVYPGVVNVGGDQGYIGGSPTLEVPIGYSAVPNIFTFADNSTLSTTNSFAYIIGFFTSSRFPLTRNPSSYTNVNLTPPVYQYSTTGNSTTCTNATVGNITVGGVTYSFLNPTQTSQGPYACRNFFKASGSDINIFNLYGTFTASCLNGVITIGNNNCGAVVTPQACTVFNGTGQYFPVNGVFSNSTQTMTCQAVSCNSGYSPSGSACVPLPATQPTTIPPVNIISDVVLMGVGSHAFQVAWKGVSTATSYYVSINQGGNPLPCTSGTQVNDPWYSANNLNNNSLYTLSVCPANSYGVGFPYTFSVTTNKSTGLPPPIQQLTFSQSYIGHSNYGVSLNWQSGGGSTASYVISWAIGSIPPACGQGVTVPAIDSSFFDGNFVQGVFAISICAANADQGLSTPVTRILNVGNSEIPLTISADTSNYNIFQAAGSPTYPANVVLTIASGVNVTSTLPAIAAIQTGSFVDGSFITLINNGNIIGAGGQGGAGNSTSGYPGGPAILVNKTSSGGDLVGFNVLNKGLIVGGGGGGGAGPDTSVGPGGGGGGGCGNGPGGAGGGGGGTLTQGGAPGGQTGYPQYGIYVGSTWGGGGGSCGQAGYAGLLTAGGAGGATIATADKGLNNNYTIPQIDNPIGSFNSYNSILSLAVPGRPSATYGYGADNVSFNWITSDGTATYFLVAAGPNVQTCVGGSKIVASKSGRTTYTNYILRGLTPNAYNTLLVCAGNDAGISSPASYSVYTPAYPSIPTVGPLKVSSTSPTTLTVTTPSPILQGSPLFFAIAQSPSQASCANGVPVNYSDTGTGITIPSDNYYNPLSSEYSYNLGYESYTFTNLDPTKTYSIAVCDSYNNALGAPTTWTGTLSSVGPSQPQNLLISGESSTSLTVSWSAGSGNPTSYLVGLKDVSNLSVSNPYNGPAACTTPVSGTSYTFTGLSPNSYSLISVCAVNSKGTSEPATIQGVAENPPAVPTGLSVTTGYSGMQVYSDYSAYGIMVKYNDPYSGTNPNAHFAVWITPGTTPHSCALNEIQAAYQNFNQYQYVNLLTNLGYLVKDNFGYISSSRTRFIQVTDSATPAYFNNPIMDTVYSVSVCSWDPNGAVSNITSTTIQTPPDLPQLPTMPDGYVGSGPRGLLTDFQGHTTPYSPGGYPILQIAGYWRCDDIIDETCWPEYLNSPHTTSATLSWTAPTPSDSYSYYVAIEPILSSPGAVVYPGTYTDKNSGITSAFVPSPELMYTAFYNGSNVSWPSGKTSPTNPLNNFGNAFVYSYGGNFANLSKTLVSGNSYTFTGLSPNTGYYAYIFTKSPSGALSAPSVIPFATAPLPPNPTGYNISGVGGSNFTMTWSGANLNADVYQLYMNNGPNHTDGIQVADDFWNYYVSGPGAGIPAGTSVVNFSTGVTSESQYGPFGSTVTFFGPTPITSSTGDFYQQLCAIDPNCVRDYGPPGATSLTTTSTPFIPSYLTYTNLSPSTTYQMYFYKYGVFGAISAPTISTFATTGTPLPQPTGLVVSSATQNSLSFLWYSGGGATTSYAYGFNSGTSVAPCTASNGSSNTFTATGLVAGGTYTFSVCAVDSHGTISLPIYKVAYTLKTLAPPPPATGLYLSWLDTQDLDYGWASGGGTTFGFKIGIAAGTAIPACTISTGSVNYYSAMGLTPNTTYTISVCALNEQGQMSAPISLTNSTWPSATSTVPAPPAVRGLVYTTQQNADGTTNASLNWSSSGGSTAAYSVLVVPNSTAAPSNCATGSPVTSPSYSLTELTPGRPYSIAVCAINSAGVASSPQTLIISSLADFSPNPVVGLNFQTTFAADGTTNLIVNWNSGGGSTNSYMMNAIANPTSAPTSCAGGTVSSATTVTINELPANTVYAIAVCSLNRSGAASAPVIAWAVTASRTAAPPIPVGLTFNTFVDAGLTATTNLTWASGGGSTYTYLITEVQGSTPPTNCVGGAALNVPGYTYYYQPHSSQYSVAVCAVSPTGATSAPAVLTYMSAGPATLPPSPQNLVYSLAVEPGGLVDANLSWISGGGSTAGYTTCDPGASIITSNNLTFHGLQPSTPYFFAICSTDLFGNVSGPAFVGFTTPVTWTNTLVAAFTTLESLTSFPPPAPGNPRIIAASLNSATIAWDSTMSSISAVKTSIRQGGVPPSCQYGQTLLSTATTYQFTNLQAGATYTVSICNVNNIGMSSETFITFTQPLPSPVQNLSLYSDQDFNDITHDDVVVSYQHGALTTGTFTIAFKPGTVPPSCTDSSAVVNVITDQGSTSYVRLNPSIYPNVPLFNPGSMYAFSVCDGTAPYMSAPVSGVIEAFASTNNYNARLFNQRGAYASPSGRFVTGATYILNANSPVSPIGVAVDSTGQNLFIADAGMISQLGSFTNSTSPGAEIGSVGFVGQVGGTCTTSGQTSGWCKGGTFSPFYGIDMGFWNPQSLSVDSVNKFIYVADTTNNRIVRLSLTSGAFMGAIGATSKTCPSLASGTQWCTGGSFVASSSNGGFSAPQSVVVDSANNLLYVADFNNRVSKFQASTGTFLGAIGQLTGTCPRYSSGSWCVGGSYQSGSGDGAFFAPSALALDSTNNVLYVADAANPRVQKFNASTGAFIGAVGSVAAANGGTCAVGNNNGWCTKGTFASLNGDGGFMRPAGLAIDLTHNFMYVSDGSIGRINKFTLSTGKFVGSIGFVTSIGTGSTCAAGTSNYYWCTGGVFGAQVYDSAFSNPQGLAIDVSNNILYVADKGNYRVSAHNASTGVFMGATGGIIHDDAGWNSTSSNFISSNLDGGFNRPEQSVADNLNDVLYVADSYNSRVVKLKASTGAFIGAIGNLGWSNATAQTPNGCPKSGVTTGWCQGGIFLQGTALGAYNLPTGVALDSKKDILYVSDTFNNRIVSIKASTGSVIGVAASVYWPNALALDTLHDALFVVGMNNVTKIQASSGTVIGSIGTVTSSTGTCPNFVSAAPGWCTGGHFAWLNNEGDPNTVDGMLTQPNGLSVDPYNDALFVADTESGRIVQFKASTGAFVGAIGVPSQCPSRAPASGAACVVGQESGWLVGAVFGGNATPPSPNPNNVWGDGMNRPVTVSHFNSETIDFLVVADQSGKLMIFDQGDGSYFGSYGYANPMANSTVCGANAPMQSPMSGCNWTNHNSPGGFGYQGNVSVDQIGGMIYVSDPDFHRVQQISTSYW